MTNKFFFSGTINKIIFENSKVMKFTLVQKSNKSRKYEGTFTTFKEDDFEIVRNNIGNIVEVEGYFFNNNYKDKNEVWHNEVCHTVTDISLYEYKNVPESEEDLPF